MNVDAKSSVRLKGIAASPGIRIGRAVMHNVSLPPAAARTIPASQIERQVALLENALRTAEKEIVELRDKLRNELDEAHAAIFDPHVLFVQDSALRDQAVARIRERRESAQFALMAVIEELARQFSQMGDAYISSRSTDLYDIGNRICKHLTSGRKSSSDRPQPYSTDVIVFAHDLSPSDTAQMNTRRVRAFATEIGGPTSHTAILAKGLEIPAVVGLGSVMKHLAPESQAIVDGYEGVVILNPTEKEIRQARNRRRRHLIRERDYRKLASLPAETIDGYRVEISANIEFPDEIPHVLEHGAQGVGLFRTEFLYLRKVGLPSEEEQFQVYRDVVQSVDSGPVIFRTLDVGGDKFFSDVSSRKELNPFLGLRAIRFCLRHPHIFAAQLRALLRASAFGRAKIMFPMVSSLGELREAKRLLEEAKTELSDSGTQFDRKIEVGIMVELPSAALVARSLAEEVDFFSIGTNDLIQYTLAVDRSNEKVAEWYDPFHPAILRLIREVVDAAHRAGIWVGVCGEMAAHPVTALLLVGMGIDELSMGALDVPKVKYFIRNVRLAEARRMAQLVRGLNSSEEIRMMVEQFYEQFRKRRLKEPATSDPAPAEPAHSRG